MDINGVWAFRAASLLLVLAAGCGGPKCPFELVSASGTITYADGKPIVAPIVKVFFAPQSTPAGSGRHLRPAETTLAENGSFAGVSTISKNDGVVPGTYRVVLEALNADTTPNTRALAAAYRSVQETPLKVEVHPNGPNVFALTVQQGP